jgi:hypothetical protein
MTKLLISDTADLTFKRKSDGKVIFTSEAQLAGISQSIEESDVFGGIGNKRVAKIRSQKAISLSTRMALFDLEYLSVTQGVAVQSNGTANVFKKEENLSVVDTTGTLSVTITGTPVDNKVTIISANGDSKEFTASAKKVTVTTGFAAGDKVTAVYRETVSGKVVVLDSAKFSEAYEVEFKTIAYNPLNNVVVSDIYFQFDNCLPSGSFEISLENGNALAPELNFDALTAANSSEIGRVIEVPRLP